MNSETQQEIIRALKLNVAQDKVPNAIPVVEVNPKLVKEARVTGQNVAVSGASVLLTTPTNQDVYVDSVCFSFIKDAACDVATGNISFEVTQGGTTKQLISFAVITLTAQSGYYAVSFPHGVKCDRNSSIRIGNNTYAAGVMCRSAAITYHIDETGNA